MRGKAPLLQLTENARIVLEKRYLGRDSAGNLTETPEELFERVARAIASVERSQKWKWERAFAELLFSRRFLPNTPTLMNAGRRKGQLSACFVLPVGDSLDSIFETLKNAAKIHQSGGGTGFSFSRIRPKGSQVKSSHGVASGPVSFMRVFDMATETIKQGGARRGANMGILRVDHPDIFEFIESKRDQKSVLNFNISVGVTEEFIRAARAGENYFLRDPSTGKATRPVNAKEVFNRIVRSAWECGDPGLIFLDRINLFNPTPRLGAMESTNPCGEQPLLPHESCNLGSVNLSLYWTGREFDWALFRKDVRVAIRFLDNVVDLNTYPIPESRRITLRNRKIGLGVMGFADLLLLMGIPYGSDEGITLGERVMSALDREAKSASASLAREKGAFPNWKGSLWERLGYPKMRNATVSTVAPTGTISMIAGASSGIEPIFAGIFYRHVLAGERLKDIHPAVERVLETKKLSAEQLTDEELSRAIGPAWKPAYSVSVENHVRTQAAFQRHSDSAVSKTVNLPKNATEADVARAYLLAYELGCKGITIYRDMSRTEQVLEHTVCRTC